VGSSLPPTLRKSLLPACLAALGLVAWSDVPLPASLRPWLALAEQQQRPAARPPATRRSTSAPSVEVASAATPGTSTPAPLEARAPASVSEDPLTLPHEHGRRVDHLRRARTLREVGDLSGALTELRRALHDDSTDEEALEQLARLARLQGNAELAQLAYARLGGLLPEDASPLVQQARLLVGLGRYAEAVRVGEEAVLRAPDDAEVYQVLGRAHLASNELAPAILRFQQAVHLEPEHGHALNNLGFAWLRAGENAKAAQVLERAAELLPHVAYVHNNLGVAWERLGRLEEARTAYATATRLSPRYVQARVNADRMGRVARVDVPTPEGLASPRAGAEPPAP